MVVNYLNLVFLIEVKAKSKYRILNFVFQFIKNTKWHFGYTDCVRPRCRVFLLMFEQSYLVTYSIMSYIPASYVLEVSARASLEVATNGPLGGKKTQKNWQFWIYYSKRKVGELGQSNLCLFDLLGIFIPALAMYFMRFMWYMLFHEFYWSKDKFYLQKIICKNFILQVTTKIINKITRSIIIISLEKRSKY